MNKPALWCLLAAVTFFVAGTTVCADTSAPSQPSGPAKVKAVRVGKSEKDFVTGMGSVKCHQTVDLGFEMSGVIAEIFVKEGDRVQKDQVLVKLDQRLLDYEMEVKKARLKMTVAQLDLARAEHAKKEELFTKEAISESELMRSAFEFQKAEAELESAKKEVEAVDGRKEQMTLKATTPGVVTKIFLKAGEVVNPNSYKILRLMNCGEVDAEISLGEKLYPMIGPGQSVTIVVDALGGKKFTGSVREVSSEVNPSNRTFTAKVKVPNPEFIIRPGMFARADIDLGRTSGPIVVPASALLPSEAGSDAVFVVKGGLALRRQVQVGQRDREKAEIVAGLQPGDVVIVEGQGQISDLSDVSVSIVGE